MRKYQALQALIETLPRTQVEILFNTATFPLLPGKSAIDRLFQNQRVALTLNLADAAPEVVDLLDALVKADIEGSCSRIFSQLFAVYGKARPDSGHPKLGSRWRYIGNGDAKDKIFSVKLLGDLGIVAESVPDIDYPPGYSFEGPYDEFYTKFVPE